MAKNKNMKITTPNKIFLNSIAVLLFITLSNNAKTQESTFITKSTFRIASNDDDAEESEYGVLEFTSSDLELVDEFSNQIVGLRFTDIDIPKGTEIINAYLQFVTDEVTNKNCNLSISGELISNATTFENINKNISSRNRTVNSIPWSPLAWNTINESSAAQKSNDISSVIQEIINQNQWTANNALVLIITGEGTRTAISHDNNPDLAPLLIIETKTPSVNIPVEKVFINEIMAVNNAIYDEFGESSDWFELYNANTEPVYIGGVYMSDDVDDLTKWQLAHPLTISAGGFALIWADNDITQGAFHASFKLSGSGETLILSQVLNQEIIEIDRVSFPAIPDDISYGRKDDGTENWMLLGQSSPNATNNSSKPALATPTITLESGIFNSVQVIEISSDMPDTRIYYTLNGNIPDSNSLQYNEQIEIDTTTLLKVIAYKNDFEESDLVERFYLFNHNSELPIINISTDPDNLWDDSTGIYVEGKNGTTHPNYNIPSNFFQPWERPALITMLEPDGSLAFREKAGIALSGNDSKKLIQKSFNLHFRKKYGTDGVFYPVFKDLDLAEFQHLKLRNSGQDFESMMMRDGLNNSIIHNVIDIDHMAYRPAIVYLNNEYWGLYGLRESLTDDYIDTHHNVEKSEINLLTREGNIIIENGSDADYMDLYNYIKNNNLAVQANYDAVEKRMDIDEFINYQITEIYYANYDWPANNQKMWSAGSNTKWRWMFYDTDASTNYKVWGQNQPFYNSLEHATDAYSSNWPNNAKSSVVFRGLLQNDKFKYEFVQRMCTYMALVFNPERVLAITDSMVLHVGNEIDREIEKWTQDYSNFGIGKACGGTKEAWESYIFDYKEFFVLRPDYMMQHLKGKFNNYDTYSLRFNYSETTEGKVYINSNTFEIPYNYTAEYFSSYPLQIKAVAKEGYHFVKWLETGETSAETNFVGLEASILTPVFAEGETGIFNEPTISNYQISIYPNPVSGDNIHVTIKGCKNGENIKLSIYNTIGQQIGYWMLDDIYEKQAININSTNWKRGVYFMKIQGEYAQNTLKFIVE